MAVNPARMGSTQILCSVLWPHARFFPLKEYADMTKDQIDACVQNQIYATTLISASHIAKDRMNLNLYYALIEEAYQCLRQAAILLEHAFDMEPSRSIIHGLTASLAAECGRVQEAKVFIVSALMGTPSDAVRTELRQLEDRLRSVGQA